MTVYNFDSIKERKGTNSVKYDALKDRFGREDLIPLWVADMDFDTPDFIIGALKERLSHPVLGYTFTPATYYDTIKEWLMKMYGWNVDQSWISYIPGIVKGIGMVLQCFTSPGDKVIIQPPVYHPFRLVPEHNGRVIVNNPLIHTEAGYTMNFEHLESVIDAKCKVLILSNPHNPAGIVWSKETLLRLAEICKRHDILVISDEIHSEMAFAEYHHTPFASVSSEAASNSITFMAPSKTFNIPGIVTSYSVVPDASLRRKFYAYLQANELNDPPLLSPIATIAAYTKGNEWRIQMLEYVKGNIDFVDSYIKENIPSIKVMRPQASFLVWLDCRGMNLPQESITDLFINGAGLALNDGAMFGIGGTGFMRLNVATSRTLLVRALSQLKDAVTNKNL